MADGKVVIGTGLDNSGIQGDLSKMESLIAGSAAAVTAALAAATAAVVTFGSAYETSMAKASTLFGDTNVNTQKLNSSILSLSNSSGKAATELNEALYQAMSAGVPVTEDMGTAVGFVDQAVKLATGGFTTSASAVDVMSTAINAYGMEASDAASISDLLITVQNKGKTTVDELSQSLGRVLPVASAFSVSLEDVGASEAKMTASGIATAESTTYLKSMLNELGDAGSTVGKTLQEKTGMSFTQLMQSGKSLGDVMQVLSESVDNDTTAFAGLWSSQEAGVGALALANGGAEAYNKTLDAMKNSAGATDDAYSKMSDTLAFKTDQMKESAKNLAISVYNDIQEPLKDAADVGTSALKDISKALSSSSFKKSLKSAADGIGEFAKSAGNMAKTVLPVLGKALTTIAKNFNTFASVALATFAAIETFKAAIGIIKGINTAMTALTEVLNMNPVFLAVTAVAALATATGVLSVASYAAIDSNRGLTTSQKELCDSIQESYDSYKEIEAARQEAVNSIGTEYTNYQMLAQELQGITDENGKVKAGYEDRAAVIVGILSQALGIEISMTDGVIANYQELVGSIDEVINKKKAEALANAYQEEYANAVKSSQEQLIALNAAKSDAASADQQVIDAQQAYDKALAESNREVQLYGQETVQTHQKLQDATTTLDEAKNAQSKLNEELQNAQEQWNGSQEAIETYEALLEAASSNDPAKVEAALQQAGGSVKNYTQLVKESGDEASQAVMDQATSHIQALQSIQDGTVTAASETTATIANNAASAVSEMSNMTGGIVGALQEMGPSAASAMASSLIQADLSGQLSTTSQESLKSFISGFDGLDTETQLVFANALFGALSGIEGLGEQLKDPATDGADAFLESLRTALEVHSPSRAVEGIFSQVWPGASNGLDSGQSDLTTKGTGVITNFLASLIQGSAGAQGVGSTLMQMFGIGISSQTGASSNAGMSNALAAQTGAGSINPSGTGSIFGSLFGAAVRGMSGITGSAGSAIATAARTAAGAINPSGTGTAFGSSFGSGISGTSGAAASAANAIATAANGAKGLAGVSGHQAGYNFGAGFSGGISSAIGSAVSAAANLAASALSAIKNTLDIHSPSRKAYALGDYTGEGFENALYDKVRDVKKASATLGNAALSGIDVSAAVSRMRAGVFDSNARVGAMISSDFTSKIEYESNKPDPGQPQPVNQTVNINQPVKSPVETARALKRVGKELAFGQ